MAILAELAVTEDETTPPIEDLGPVEGREPSPLAVWGQLVALRNQHPDLSIQTEQDKYREEVRGALKTVGISEFAPSPAKENLWSMASMEMAFRKWGPGGARDLNKLRRLNDGTVRTYDAVYDVMYRQATGMEITIANDTYTAINNWIERNAALARRFAEERAGSKGETAVDQEERRLFSGWQAAERAKFDRSPVEWTQAVRERQREIARQSAPNSR